MTSAMIGATINPYLPLILGTEVCQDHPQQKCPSLFLRSIQPYQCGNSPGDRYLVTVASLIYLEDFFSLNWRIFNGYRNSN